MTEITVILYHMSRVCCQPKLKGDLLKSEQRAKRTLFCLKQRTKNNKILPDYRHVEHRVEIVAMTENVHDHDMLSKETDERPTEKYAENKMLVR